ncbi:MAG: Quercetin 2,3-dioxygenase [Phycisphaerales bacterium]|nr:Quercetin 2,3-dioxygenase [Phycisphaerales bacterium]
MLTIRRANERGRTDIDWLDSWHTFSFGEYHDPRHMNFRDLRVINDDRVAGGGGFDTHPHRDMEIITVVLDGELKHRDSLGSEGSIRPGEVQVMTAGRDIRHSEFNGSRERPVHLLQIWIMPEARGLPAAYAQKDFGVAARRNKLVRVAGRDGVERDGALKINQDVDVYVTDLDGGATVGHALRPGRGAWVHVATGSATVNGQKLGAGDAVGIEGAAEVTIEGASTSKDGGGAPATVLVFDCR